MIVDRFFVWVSQAGVEQRVKAVAVLVRAWAAPETPSEEREGLEAALTLVAEDRDPAVRRALAEALAERDDAPRHLLADLAWDHPSVAEIVVARSECLIDPELVELAAGGAPEIQAAVARRRRVASTVASALAEAADRPAVITLLANPGADLPAAALERIVDRFGEYADLREALMNRPHVPITVRHRVLEKLAEAMGNLVVVRDWMRGERAETVTRDAKERATVALAAAAGDAETTVLVEHLRRTGQLTTRLMLRAACVGDLRFVEEGLSVLASVPSRRVAALVAEGRETAFRALYGKARMPERAYPAFAAALEVHRDLLRETGGWDGRPGDRARFARRLVERVLTRWTAFDRRDGDDLLALLRAFAADAAREHARAVVAERAAEATRLLAAPADGVEVEDFTVEPPAAAVDLDAAPPVEPAASLIPDDDAFVAFSLDDEIAAAIRRALDDETVPASPVPASPVSDPQPSTEAFVLRTSIDAPVPATPDAAPAEPALPRFVFLPPAPEEVEPEPIAADDLDEPVGLFSHVCLEDLPAEWLTAAAAPRVPLEADPVAAFGATFLGGLRGSVAA